MRIAVLILGLLLGLLMFLQTTVLYTFSGFVGEEATQASAIGILMALLWLVACALVLPFPIASVVAFGIAALLGYLASPDFPDLAIWASASLVLAVMSFFGWRGKRKADREKAQEKEMMRAFMQYQMYGDPAPVSQPNAYWEGAPGGQPGVYYRQGQQYPGYYQQGQQYPGYYQQGQQYPGYYQQGQQYPGYYQQGQQYPGYGHENGPGGPSPWGGGQSPGSS